MRSRAAQGRGSCYTGTMPKSLAWDGVLIVVSIVVAIVLAQTEALYTFLASAREWELLGSFVAGIFFTSIFTTAPAIVALGELARAHSVLPVALAGAAGAVLGDLLIFRFIRDRLSGRLTELLAHPTRKGKLRMFLTGRYFRWLTFFIGGLVIASPLPDEMGISLLGFSTLGTSAFLCLSFVFNFVGIVLIGLAAQAL